MKIKFVFLVFLVLFSSSVISATYSLGSWSLAGSQSFTYPAYVGGTWETELTYLQSPGFHYVTVYCNGVFKDELYDNYDTYTCPEGQSIKVKHTDIMGWGYTAYGDIYFKMDPPVVTSIDKNGTEDTTVTFSSADFSAGFYDSNGYVLSKIKILSLPSNGILKYSGDDVAINQVLLESEIADLTFEPDTNWNGNTSFTWRASNGVVWSSSLADFDINLSAVADVPSVSDVSKVGDEDVVMEFSATDFSSGFADPDGNSMTKIKIITLPSNGTLKLNGVAVSAENEIDVNDLEYLVFEPNSNWYGSTSFSWNGFDGVSYAPSSANVNITVLSVLEVPSVSSIDKTGVEDEAIVFGSTDFENAFTDPEDASLNSIKILSLPENGVLLFSGEQVVIGQEISVVDISNLIFEPDNNWNGDTSFFWNGSNGVWYASSSASINISVSAVQDSPVVTSVAKAMIGDVPYLSRILGRSSVNFNSADFVVNGYIDVDGDDLQKIKITSLSSDGDLKLFDNLVEANQEINISDVSGLAFFPREGWFGETNLMWNGFDGNSYANTQSQVNVTVYPWWSNPNVVGQLVGSASGVFVGVMTGATLCKTKKIKG